MGTIYTRGTRTNPKYYLHYRDGSEPDGTPHYVMRAAKGARSKPEARKELARRESMVSQGLNPTPLRITGTVSALLTQWIASLSNRSAYEDRKVAERDLVPALSGMTLDEIDVHWVNGYLDILTRTKLPSTNKIMAPQTQRHRFNLLSRFFSWLVEKGLAKYNPCKSVPRNRRPKIPRTPSKHLEDDSLVPVIMEALGGDLGLMFYLCNRSGIRPGEVAGLRMRDLENIHEGVIAVCKSNWGELKESKNGSKPHKWVPAPMDIEKVLGPHIAKRKRDGAGKDDLLFIFPTPSRKRKGDWKAWPGYHSMYIRNQWRKVANALGLPVELKWYGGTRHAMATRNLENGATYDEVCAALGQSSTAVTKRYYDHAVRKSFGSVLRQQLGPTKAKSAT